MQEFWEELLAESNVLLIEQWPTFLAEVNVELLDHFSVCD